MTKGSTGSLLRCLAALFGLALLTACKTVTAPPTPRIISTAPPPPPLRPQIIPYRPVPPGGASPEMVIPALGADGVRDTVIARMTPLEAVWNFRAAWNVAALNCVEPHYQEILDGYKLLLGRYARRLAAVNRELDRQYRGEHGAHATREREAYMTKVYNYFAMPPAHYYFCDAALQLSRETLAAPPGDIDAYAIANIQRLASAFERFYREFEQYRIDVAVWDAQYGPFFRHGSGQPGGVIYASAAPAGVGLESTPRVPLSAPGSGAEAVAEPAIQPLPVPGPGR